MKTKPKTTKLFIAIDDQYRVLYVGWGPPPSGMLQGLFTLITDNAEYLYIALSGHRFGNEADTYTLERAKTVRNLILEMEQVGHPVQTLCRVIERWGDKIDPWLGATRLEGTVLALDDPSDRTVTLTEANV